MRVLFVLLSLFSVIGAASSASADGTLEHVQIWSDVLDEERTVGVYRPEGYGEETGYPPRQYPVVYFLHGCVCPEYDYNIYWTWGTLKAKLDEGIGNGTLQPVIVVTPDGCAAPYCGSYYSNSELYGMFESHVIGEIVPFIDSNYLTTKTPAHRAVMGHSMGAFGALKLALKHPDVFTAAAAHGGPVDIVTAAEVSREILLAEADPDSLGPPYVYDHEAGFATITRVMYARSGGLSPNLDNDPTRVDFPFDENGDLVEAVLERWDVSNPPRLARELLERGETPPRIYFDCGLEDHFQELPVNEAFAESLDVLGIEYTFETGPWGHNDVQDRIPVALAFLLDRDIVGVEETEMSSRPAMHAYPNPASGDVTIEFALGNGETAELAVFDSGGRVVRTIHSTSSRAGRRTLVWDGKDRENRRVAQGVYFLSLRTNEGRQIGQLVRVN